MEVGVEEPVVRGVLGPVVPLLLAPTRLQVATGWYDCFGSAAVGRLSMKTGTTLLPRTTRGCGRRGLTDAQAVQSQTLEKVDHRSDLGHTSKEVVDASGREVMSGTA